MRQSADKEEMQKDLLLEQCFNCLVSTGLEGVSIREFQNATGMTASSLYYWFSDKDEIVLDAVGFGINKIVRELCDFAMSKVNNVHDMTEEFPVLLQKYSSHLKLVFQVVTSPRYGKDIIKFSNNFNMLYDEYAERLSERLKVPYKRIRTLVDLFISSCIDCVIWNEWEKLSREIDMIIECLNIQLEISTKGDR